MPIFTSSSEPERTEPEPFLAPAADPLKPVGSASYLNI
jgi:hypothetical protein